MNDKEPSTSPGPGYWQASDGSWYPPQQAGGPPPSPPGAGPVTAKQAKAAAKAAVVQAKALRPWYKKKRIMIPLGIVLIGVAAALAGGGAEEDTTPVSAAGASAAAGEPSSEDATSTPQEVPGSGAAANPNSSEEGLFPNRPDEKKGDKERHIGGAADLSGYTATVTAAQAVPELSMFQTDGYLVADVSLLNRDSSAQSYNTFDWKLITPTGTIIDPYFGGDQLGFGDLAAGGTVTGQLIWETKGVPGDYYIIFDPDLMGKHRGVWKVTV